MSEVSGLTQSPYCIWLVYCASIIIVIHNSSVYQWDSDPVDAGHLNLITFITHPGSLIINNRKAVIHCQLHYLP